MAAQTLADATLLAVMLTAAITDLAREKVYNWLTYPAMLAGLTIWTIGGWVDGGIGGALSGLGWSALGLAVIGGPMLAFFAMDAGIRGGDVKLAAALGALALPLLAVWALFYGFLAGFVVAVAVMVRRRIVGRTLGRVWRFLWIFGSGGRPTSPSDESSPKIPTALGWAIGTAWALAEQRFFGGQTLWNWIIGR